MQKINIKKLTKEKLAEMYAEAKSAYDAAMDDEERRVRELEEQSKELIALTEKLEANEKALDEMTALYKSADHAAKNMRGKIEYLDKALSEATEKREAAKKEAEALRSEIARANEARKKAESEGRELAKQLGKREIELAKVKQECESELAKQRVEAEKAFMKMHATINGLLKRLEAQKDISEDYHKSLKWCMAHPWRNLWRCVKEHFRF
nr:MAG TPA: outer capsid protein sigma-1 attachment protein [Caudoviricetes sp.]